jgi:hypothetical protein
MMNYLTAGVVVFMSTVIVIRQRSGKRLEVRCGFEFKVKAVLKDKKKNVLSLAFIFF